MKQINVLLADDSFLIRNVLKDALSAEGFHIIGEAKNGKEAIDLVKAKKPDVLILDCEMPVMDGLSALQIIMQQCPLPVFMFSTLTHAGAEATIKALSIGAIDFLPKPGSGTEGIQDIIPTMSRKIRYVAARGLFQSLSRKNKTPTTTSVNKIERPSTTALARPIDLIAIGSSTGGVQAATNVITKIPKNCPPIVWVQHMPPSFTLSLANRLDGLSKVEVRQATHGEPLKKGVCYLAAGGSQMKLIKRSTGYHLAVEGTEKVNGHCPSCDVLFDSVAQYYNKNVIGIILTGMGNDGAAGLLKMKNKGALILGQDEASCVVYGMPKAAFENGAVDVQADINDITSLLIKYGQLDPS